MGSPVAKKDDMVVDVDTHITMVTAGPSQVPTPLPYPFSGKLTEDLASTVFIDGKPVALEGSGANNDPGHIPMGGTFQSQPKDKGKVSSASGVTFADDKGVARNGDPVECCNDPSDQDTGHVIATGSTVFSG